MRIKKLGALILAGTLMCTTPVMPVMASDATETVQEIITDNEIDSLVSDPNKVVDIIMYAKDQVAQQDISDEQIKEIIQTAESTFNVSLTEEEENKLVNIVKEVKNANIDEEQLRSTVNKVYDKLEEMGIGKEEVKSFLHKMIDFAKSLLEVDGGINTETGPLCIAAGVDWLVAGSSLFHAVDPAAVVNVLHSK